MKSYNCIRKIIIIYACLLIILEVLLRELKGRGGSVGVAVFSTAAAGDYAEVGRCVCASYLSYKLILFLGHCCPSPLATRLHCHLFQHCFKITISEMGGCIVSKMPTA